MKVKYKVKIPSPLPAMYNGYCKMCGEEVIKNKTLIASWTKDLYICLKCHKELLIHEEIILYLDK